MLAWIVATIFHNFIAFTHRLQIFVAAGELLKRKLFVLRLPKKTAAIGTRTRWHLAPIDAAVMHYGFYI
jgi:hypothetical protein